MAAAAAAVWCRELCRGDGEGCLLRPVVRRRPRSRHQLLSPHADLPAEPRGGWGHEVPRVQVRGVTMCSVVPVSAVLLLLLCSSQGQYSAKTLLPAPAHHPQSRRHATHFSLNRLKLFIDCVFANHHCDILGGVVTVSSADKWVQSFVVPWLWI